MNSHEKLQEIHRLLDEAYKHYFAHGCGHWKSDEAHITIEYGNYWDRENHESGDLPVTGVEIYSYVLGPNRRHTFDNLDEALEVVRQWHRKELSTSYDENGDIADEQPEFDEPCLYARLETARQARRDELEAKWDKMCREADDEFYRAALLDAETKETK